LTATAVAAFGVPFRHYQCWYSWSRVSTNIGVAGYFAVAAGGGGLLGWGGGGGGEGPPSPKPPPHRGRFGCVARRRPRAALARCCAPTSACAPSSPAAGPTARPRRSWRNA